MFTPMFAQSPFTPSEELSKEELNSQPNPASSQENHAPTIIGHVPEFPRSYTLLVRHHSDFLLDQELYLAPAEMEWRDWTRFAHRFRSLRDAQVTKRYHFSQIRLSRLD